MASNSFPSVLMTNPWSQGQPQAPPAPLAPAPQILADPQPPPPPYSRFATAQGSGAAPPPLQPQDLGQQGQAPAQVIPTPAAVAITAPQLPFHPPAPPQPAIPQPAPPAVQEVHRAVPLPPAAPPQPDDLRPAPAAVQEVLRAAAPRAARRGRMNAPQGPIPQMPPQAPARRGFRGRAARFIREHLPMRNGLSLFNRTLGRGEGAEEFLANPLHERYLDGLDGNPDILLALPVQAAPPLELEEVADENQQRMVINKTVAHLISQRAVPDGCRLETRAVTTVSTGPQDARGQTTEQIYEYAVVCRGFTDGISHCLPGVRQERNPLVCPLKSGYLRIEAEWPEEDHEFDEDRDA